MTPARLGLFGGTFDPPHLGHVAALRAAAALGRFELIEVTVAGDPYLKGGGVRPTLERLEMAHAAFDGLELVRVSDREIRRSGPSYTIDSVRELLDTTAQVDLIVGADLTDQLDGWREAAALRELVEVGVVPRPGGGAVHLRGWRYFEIPMTPVDLSSTFIREIAPDLENLRRYLPEDVIPFFVGTRG